MADLKSKPPLFLSGSKSLSARALNQILTAIPRLITGGRGINIQKFGDRIAVALSNPQGKLAPVIILVIIISIEDEYLICNRDGATIKVAKPKILRGENTSISPAYVVDDEIVAVRVPSSRIEVESWEEDIITWVDMNNAGRQAVLFAKITGSAVITTNRWVYSFVEVVLNQQGTFTTKTGGISGNASNTIEANNAACDLLGSGDDCTEFPIGITEQPIGIGAVVQMRSVYNCEDPRALEYLFTVPNNAGGTCA